VHRGAVLRNPATLNQPIKGKAATGVESIVNRKSWHDLFPSDHRGRFISTPREEPSLVVGFGECDERDAQFESPCAQRVFLQVSDEALGDAIVLWFAPFIDRHCKPLVPIQFTVARCFDPLFSELLAVRPC